MTSWDGLGSDGGTTSVTSTSASSGAGGSPGTGGTSSGGGGTGGSAGSGGAGGAPADAGPHDAGSDAPDRCTAGGFYCGGDKVMGDSDTLYKCHTDGSATAVEQCQNGCTIRPPPQDDTCACQPGGFYCGGDKLIGDKDSLYKCKSDGSGSGSFVKHCGQGCVVVPGQDDHCKG